MIGNNGIIKRAKESKEDYTIASIKEKLDLIEASKVIQKQGTITLDEYFEELEKQKIEPHKVTHQEKKSNQVGIVEVDDKYSFIIKKDEDITVQYEGEVGKIDRSEPDVKIVLAGEEIQQVLPISLQVTITSNDKPIDGAKWILNNMGEEIGTDEKYYTETLENTNQMSMEINEINTYYLHVVTKDKYGVPMETIKGPITISERYHIHEGSSNANGGCYTQGVHNHVASCNRVCSVSNTYGGWKDRDDVTHSSGVLVHDHWWSHSACGQGSGSHTCQETTGNYTHNYYGCKNQPINYWNLGCNKTDTTQEGYYVNY